MSDRALKRFIGIDDGADERALLGVAALPARLTREAIHEALAARLLRVDRHPDRGGEQAVLVRTRLREAAERLEKMVARAAAPAPTRTAAPPSPPSPPLPTVDSNARPNGPTRESPRPPAGHPMERGVAGAPRRPDPAAPAARPPAPPPRPLTAFDRMVFATLVSGGGWNAHSRERLVALAAMRGVGVDGLVKVVSGLAHHVRRGGARPGAHDMAEGAALLLANQRDAPPSRLEVIVDHVAESVRDELRSERLAPRVRVTAIFAIVTMAMLAILVKVMLSDPVQGPRGASSEPALSGASEASGVAALSPVAPTDPAGGSPTEADDSLLGAVMPAKFPRPPMFEGMARPAASLQLLERVAGLPALVDTLGRRIAVGDEQTSAAVDREWAVALDEAGGCWPLMDVASRRRVVGAFIEALCAADVPMLAERFVGPLHPQAATKDAPGGAAAVGVPSLWTGSFRAGLLGEIMARGALLPPAVVERAGAALREAIVEPAPGGLPGFDEAAGRWLDESVVAMVARLPSNTGFADEWEQWIVAQRAVRGGLAFQRAIADAAGAVLRSGVDLGAAGPSSDVLGRLVLVLDFNGAPAVRTALLAWFVDPGINADALWVLTSLIQRKGDARWFRPGQIVDWSATPEMRAAIARSIASHWAQPPPPSVARRPMTAVANDALEKWTAALRALEARVAASRDPSASVRTLLLAAMLNHAAASFEVGDDDRARELVATVQEALSPRQGEWSRRGSLARPARGSSGGVDGEFADAFEQAERNTEQRLGLLRQLRLRGGGDLGPRDAEALVRAVTRGAPPEVRSVARGVLIEAFPHGPAVTLELLDQLADVGPSDELGQVISQVADATLPPARSNEWTRAARMALLRHALLLRDDVAVDADAELLAETMRGRLEAASSGSPSAATSLPPALPAQQVLARVVDAWRRRAGATIAPRPVPADLAELDRRRALRDRLADGALTVLVAEQVAHLELAAYIFAASAPWLEAGCRELVEKAATERAGAETATGQAVATELALAHLWELAMTGDPAIGSGSREIGAPRDGGGLGDLGVVADGERRAAPSDATAPPKAPPAAGDNQRRPARPTVAPPSAEPPTGVKGRRGKP